MPSSGGGSSTSSGYLTAYSGKTLIIQDGPSGSCNTSEGVIIAAPKVDPNGDPYSDDFTLINNCDGTYQVSLEQGASGSPKGQDSANGCLNSIASDPINSQINVSVGDVFCIESTKQFVAYVAVTGVDGQGNVTLSLDGWRATD